MRFRNQMVRTQSRLASVRFVAEYAQRRERYRIRKGESLAPVLTAVIVWN